MNAASLTKALGGRWHGSYGTCRCPTHDDREPSLSVRDGDGGDVLVKCHAGCDWRDIKDVLRGRGLLPEFNKSAGTPRRLSPRPGLTSGPDPEVERRKEFARRIWAKALPITDTPAEVYLRERGLCPGPDGWPLTLRYHPALKHTATGVFLPALVAAVTRWPGHDVSGVHRTFICIDGKGKAPVSGIKMMLGPCAGGAVRLAPAGPELAIAEGIETALSVQQESCLPAWACLSTSGLQSVRLPPAAQTVIIAADSDEPGEKAAQTAAKRFLAEGRMVKIARPPLGMDFNDMLKLPAGVAVISDKRRRERAHG